MITKSNWLKLIPIFLAGTVFIWAWIRFGDNCSDLIDKVDCLYTQKYAYVDPIFYGVKWLLITLLAMIFVPWRTYKAWALTVLPVTLVVSYLLISSISVYSSGVLSISRAQMAVNCAVVFAALSVVFVLASEWYWRRKSRVGV